MNKFGIGFVVLLLALGGTAFGQFVPDKESLDGLYPGKAYSPYAQR